MSPVPSPTRADNPHPLTILVRCRPPPSFFLPAHLASSSSSSWLQNFLALIPLALTLGDVTEDLALRVGDVVGGLLNATFGNVVEVSS